MLFICQANDCNRHKSCDFSKPFLLNNKYKMSQDSWFSEDKAKHFLASFISTVFINELYIHSFDESKKRSQFVSGGFVFTIGFLKEINDYSEDNNFFSWKDLNANILGICLGIIVSGIK